ncbi:hypothetical protein ZEAMMB73_Zm00001d034370 [Zea mays]|uniref:Uncharacterized protein n=1 Tax=Zea mays TaxID=4577 RepID=A0A1D6L6Z2_MAIZE|nr:hypothetical protein ZEAMMB73_Zm00001d034370 [Zea mays]
MPPALAISTFASIRLDQNLTWRAESPLQSAFASTRPDAPAPVFPQLQPSPRQRTHGRYARPARGGERLLQGTEALAVEVEQEQRVQDLHGVLLELHNGGEAVHLDLHLLALHGELPLPGGEAKELVLGGVHVDGDVGSSARMAAAAGEEAQSSATKQKVAAAKQYIENHYKSQMKSLQELKERHWMLERKLADADVSEEEQNNILKDLEKKEAEYMRLRRHKMGVDDFELLTIIGRGAFGEVRLCREKTTSNVYAMKKLKKSKMLRRGQLLSKKMVDTAKESIGGSATSLELYGKMEEVFIKMDSEENIDSVDRELKNFNDAVLQEGNEEGRLAREFDSRKHIEAHLPVRVNE